MVSAEWFFGRMSMTEARDILKAQAERAEKRGHLMYEVARFHGSIGYKSMTGKNLEIEFPWDGKMDDDEVSISAEDAEALRQAMKTENEKLERRG